MNILLIIIFYLIQQITFILPENCEPDCSNQPKDECQKFEIELRAILVRCTSNYAVTSEPTTPACDLNRKTKVKNTLNCLKKISITLKLTNQGETTTSNQYIIIDHVKDGKTGAKLYLLNPYVFVIRQESIMQLYGLKYVSVVNGEVTEKVISKRGPNFKEYNDFSQFPSCRKLIYKGKSIPFSGGFRCSCDKLKNARRQFQMVDEENNESPPNLQEFIHRHIKRNNEIVFNRPRRIRYKRNSNWYGYNDYLKRYRYQIDPQRMLYPSPKIYHKRYENPNYSEEQTRGGRNCKKNNTSVESVHCAQFSQVWYSVYELSNPILEHTIYVKIFEKRERSTNGGDWFDLTAGFAVQIGTLNSKFINKERSYQVQYYNNGPGYKPILFAIDPKAKLLMIKRNSRNDDQTIVNPAEFLVVNKKDVNLTGEECNTAGVGYKAFFTQPRRCSVPPGSCLKNQPNELWRQDTRACKRCNKGKYFLKNFARVPEEEAIRTSADNTKYLALYLDAKLRSAIDIDVRIDDNIVYENQVRSQITEVYVDGTAETVTTLTIKLFNNGLFSSTFHPKLSDCPLELPVDWSNLEGESVLIPPQHNAIFTMRLFGSISIPNFYCTVQALNDINEILAMRRIRIIKNDRCICAWHCRCACLETTGLGCKLISLKHYKAAGFIGSMPLTTTMVQKNSLDHALFSFCYVILLLTFLLLILGLSKALLGLCYVPFGIWGLDILIGLRPLLHYYERELRCRKVQYDCEHWPVHPDTRQRTVRITSESLEFFLNIIFFFTYPIMLLLIVSIKLCCPYKKKEKKGNKKTESKRCKSCDTDSEDLDQFEFDELSNSNTTKNY